MAFYVTWLTVTCVFYDAKAFCINGLTITCVFYDGKAFYITGLIVTCVFYDSKPLLRNWTYCNVYLKKKSIDDLSHHVVHYHYDQIHISISSHFTFTIYVNIGQQHLCTNVLLLYMHIPTLNKVFVLFYSADLMFVPLLSLTQESS